MLAHGWCGGIGIEPAVTNLRERRNPPIYLRVDRCTARRDADACEHLAQFAGDPAEIQSKSRFGRSYLAASVPRHGAHRRHYPAALHRLSCASVRTLVLFAETDSLAGSHFELPRHLQRRPELRLRDMSSKNPSGAG